LLLGSAGAYTLHPLTIIQDQDYCSSGNDTVIFFDLCADNETTVAEQFSVIMA
jgi:hypothetical protein